MGEAFNEEVSLPRADVSVSGKAETPAARSACQFGCIAADCTYCLLTAPSEWQRGALQCRIAH